MSYQKGDKSVMFGGRNYGLRLTMGALAEINSELDMSGPSELAAGLRQLSPSQVRVILQALMRACDPDIPTDLTANDVAKFLPEICGVFEEAFGEPA